MVPLDPKAYEAAVVKPLRRWEGRELPDDLVTRYAVDLTMSEADLGRRLTEIRSHWNKSAQSAGKSPMAQKIYKAFLRADEELKQKHGLALNQIEWWRRHATARAGTRQHEVDALAETLGRSFGELGLVATGQLEATVRATSAALAPDEVTAALRKAGVSLSTPSALPKSAEIDKTVYRTLVTRLADAQVGSVVELLYGDVTGFALLTEFRCVPAHSRGLTADAVREATDRENKRSGNQAAREALGILGTAVRATHDLRELALFQLLDSVREDHAQGAPAGVLLTKLVKTKLDPAEARQAVFSVLNEKSTAPVDGLAKVKELLESGRLLSARQALAGVTGADAIAEARELVSRQDEQVRQSLDAAHRAMAAGDEANARRELVRAAALAVDDAEIAGELCRIPPPPVRDVSAQPDGVGVRVSWRSHASHGAGTYYRVVRRDSRVPADPDDGTVVNEQTATALVDLAAPAGSVVAYAVFARVADGMWSRSASAMIEVLPPVHDVRLTTEDGYVDARWQVHPSALSVLVQRGTGPDPVAVPTSGRSSFQDRSVDPTGEHVYTIAARYRRADGKQAQSAAVQVRTTSSGQAAAVNALTLSAVSDGASSIRIRARWQQEPDAEVVIRRSPHPGTWQFRAVVALADLSRYGTELSGRVTVDGAWHTLTADVPPGHFHYVPFTMGPSGAVCGQAADLGISSPVTDLAHQRLGDEVLLSWRWPGDTGSVEVSWKTKADSRRYRLTRQEYQDVGGCRFRSGANAVDVSVRTVVVTETGECFSAPVSATVPAMAAAVTYSVEMARRPLVGGGTVRVTLSAEQVVNGHTVLLVAAPGSVMPRRPSDGQVLIRTALVVDVDSPTLLTAELPRLRKPFWVRCFLESGAGGSAARLVDPPTRQLKVS